MDNMCCICFEIAVLHKECFNEQNALLRLRRAYPFRLLLHTDQARVNALFGCCSKSNCAIHGFRFNMICRDCAVQITRLAPDGQSPLLLRATMVKLAGSLLSRSSRLALSAGEAWPNYENSNKNTTLSSLIVIYTLSTYYILSAYAMGPR